MLVRRAEVRVVASHQVGGLQQIQESLPEMIELLAHLRHLALLVQVEVGAEGHVQGQRMEISCRSGPELVNFVLLGLDKGLECRLGPRGAAGAGLDAGAAAGVVEALAKGASPSQKRLGGSEDGYELIQSVRQRRGDGVEPNAAHGGCSTPAKVSRSN